MGISRQHLTIETSPSASHHEAMTTQQLPPAARKQNYVTISALKGGSLTLGDRHFVAPADADAKRTVPSLCFLITHPNPPKTAFTAKRGPLRLMFDLGFRSRKERYKEVMQRHIETRAPYSFEPGLLQQLEQGGLSPNDVDVVMLSHVCSDHRLSPLRRVLTRRELICAGPLGSPR